MTNDDTTERIAAMLSENMRRKNALHKPYNPVTGRNAYGERIIVEMPDAPIPLQYVPKQMLDENPFAKSLAQAGCLDSFILAKLHKRPSFELKEGLWTKWLQIRIRYDFEFWAAMFVKIKDKKSQNDIPFILNRPQQRLLATLEGMRLAGKPIRLIMLKARQWGGSTLIQMYMAWIQLVHRKTGTASSVPTSKMRRHKSKACIPNYSTTIRHGSLATTRSLHSDHSRSQAIHLV